MFNFINKLLDSNEKTLKRYRQTLSAINELAPKYAKLTPEELTGLTPKFKERLGQGETLNQLLPDAFAAVREAASRTLSIRHFDVQLMAAMAFHDGKVAEQKTGEGKTLSATPALYLNALTGLGAHLVTVNDYLAQRDAGWMAPLFEALGMQVGVIFSGKGDLPAAIIDTDYQGESRGDHRLEHLKPVSRKDAYLADITYGTNNEFGFDYLRDNMAQSLEDMVQRQHHFAIVDEVDSILIDEARTPLIISAPDTEPTQKYYEFAKLVDSLTRDTDYNLDEKLRTATLTDYGLRRLEKRLNVSNLYENDYNTIHHVEQALKAKTLFLRDKDYVVKDNQVIIVDEHTGRLMFGRRYSEGLHQAIEAKESVTIQKESRTLATISLQNYFRMYQKLAGMTGTAATETEEFRAIYNMDVVVVPTNRDIVRKDQSDLVYKTKRAKFGAIVKEVREKFEAGQPVLLGTRSIEQNDVMARYLKKMKIPHQVLNAKNNESEAKILSDAGRVSAVTVATNIAGRGVDIVLGGSPPEKPEGKNATKKALADYDQAYKVWEKDHQKVLELGGLHVLGTERHDARRIDNQLRGRSGRQGDPGSSRFYVSLEDDIMRIFGGEQVAKIMDFLKIPEDQPIESGMVSKSIEQAQSKVESFHFDQRKRVVEYDDVMNKQREIIYKRRYQILKSFADPESDQIKVSIQKAIDDEIQGLVVARSADGYTDSEYEAILQEFLSLIPFDKNSQAHILETIKKEAEPEKIVDQLQAIAQKTYTQKEQEVGEKAMRHLERFVMLSSIDRMWMNHLDAMDDLREGIWLRGGKEQVISEYKKEAFDMFSRLMDSVNAEVAHSIYRTGIVAAPAPVVAPETMVAHKAEELAAPAPPPAETEAETKPKSSGTGALAAALAKTAHHTGSSDGRTPVLVKPDSGPKIGRNDPCPCGAVNPNTGKPYKYKKCGMIGAPYHKG